MPSIFNKYLPGMYDEEKLRSEPFKFIGLPLYMVLIFILYWFIYCPLMFVKVRLFYRHHYSTWPQEWPYYFWAVAFVIFMIMMAILVYLWKWTPKKKNEMYEVNYVEEKRNSTDSDEKKGVKSENTPLLLEEKERKEPKTQEMEMENVDEKVSTPLTPRELFFRDLIESASKSFSSSNDNICEQMINSEREQTISLEQEHMASSEQVQLQEPREVILANVSPTRTYLSNIFMFVNGNSDSTELEQTKITITKEV